MSAVARAMTTARVVVTLAVAASCDYSARFEDCAIACSASSGCPSGFMCSLTESRCRPPGFTIACAADDGGNDGGTGIVVVTTLAGSPGVPGSTDGTGSAARFNFPLGLAVDSQGNVFVADENNFTVRKVTSATTPPGIVTTIAGNPGVSGSTDGVGSGALFGQTTGVATTRGCTGCAVYVADYGNSTIRTVYTSVSSQTLAGSPGLQGSTDGTGSAARFNHPIGLGGVDVSGNIYVADGANNTIRKINVTTGAVTTLAGSPGVSGSADGTGSTARFNTPYGVAVDKDGNIYVADSANNTIRKIAAGGVVTTLAGSAGVAGSADGTGSTARFNYPQGVAVDDSGNIYVADTNNETIRKVTPAGVVTTLAGSPGVVGSTDGAGSAARFSEPRGVAVDKSGNVYVADSQNNTIRKLTP